MPRYERDSKIKLLKKEYLISDLLEILINLPAENVISFFNEINLNFPRKLRVEVLRKVLRTEVLKTREQRATLADEMNYRLSWFNQFTEVQLNNLFEFYSDPDLEKLYFEEFWLAIIEFITNKPISENDFVRLLTTAETHAKKNGIKLAYARSYNNDLNVIFYDEKSEIDGLKQDVIRPVLYKSSTLTEIRELGLKYDVNVPKRLRKAELLEIIVSEIKDRGEYTEELEAKLNNMSIIVLQRYAIKNNIKASTELKKEEVIEYILSNASTTKESYFIPSSSVYEIEAHEIGDAMPEVIFQEEVVVEEEPIVEEIVEEEPIVEEIVEEVVEEVIEEVVEEVVEEVKPVEEVQVVVHETRTIVEENLFDYESVEATHLNIVEYQGKKTKRISKYLNSIDVNTDANETNEDKTYQVELVSMAPDKKPFRLGSFLLKLLINIIIILLVITLILFIYSGITYKGLPSMDKFEQGFSDFLNSIFGTKGNLFNTFRKVIINLFKL